MTNAYEDTNDNQHSFCSDELAKAYAEIKRLRVIPPNVLAFVAANLPAFDAMARLAVFGASKHPGGALGPDGVQTYADHLAHASAHLARARKGEERDTETGELHVAHAATRLVYAIGMIASGDERRSP